MSKYPKIKDYITKNTRFTTSLVARASMSAQETLLVQRGSLSTAAFAFTTVSKPSPASEISSG